MTHDMRMMNDDDSCADDDNDNDDGCPCNWLRSCITGPKAALRATF